MSERREKEYDYDRWLKEGYYLHDYDFKTEEFVLRPLSEKKIITPDEARGLSPRKS